MCHWFFCVSAELKEAVRTWPHTDPVSWAQRTSAVALVRRLDQSFNKAVTALQQNDPKYYRGEISSCRQTSSPRNPVEWCQLCWKYTNPFPKQSINTSYKLPTSYYFRCIVIFFIMKHQQYSYSFTKIIFEAPRVKILKNKQCKDIVHNMT